MSDDHDDDEDEFDRPQSNDFPYDGWDKPSRVRKPGKVYSPHYKGDNSGGFGNPPVSGQRKKGQPGGPGRPRGSTSLEAALKRAFRRKLPIVRDGRLAKLHPTDILAERIVEAILAKNLTPAMIELARRLMEQYGPRPLAKPSLGGNSDDFSLDEKKILSALLGRYSGSVPGQTRRHVSGTVSEAFPIGEFRLFTREDGYLGLERVTTAQTLLPAPDSPRFESREKGEAGDPDSQQ